MIRTRALAALALAVAAAAAGAESAWVSDRLELGVHESPALSSTILELLPSGAAVEVLERNGALARVRTESGTSGWVDAAFLAASEPARARIETLERELAAAHDELAAVQGQLADAQAKLVAGESAAAESPPGEQAQEIPSEALREMQRLAQENQRLKQTIAELEAMQRMAREQADEARAAAAAATSAAARRSAPAVEEDPLSAGRWKTWHLVLLASVLLLAFSAGGWVVDWSVRRRHGGFRV